jgi:hypothetical protein
VRHGTTVTTQNHFLRSIEVAKAFTCTQRQLLIQTFCWSFCCRKRSIVARSSWSSLSGTCVCKSLLTATQKHLQHSFKK